MRIQVSRHVYGSITGYQTLASSSEVTTAEIKELETLSFGQTTDYSYLESLKEHPVYLCRQMRSSNRWAITRVLKGRDDDYERVTLLFITVLISMSDWLDGIHSDVKCLLSRKKLWAWEREREIPEVSIEVSHEDQKASPQTIRNVLSLLSIVEATAKKQRHSIVVRESTFTQEDIRWLNMILPMNEKKKFSCAVRVLNDSLPFTLISMSNLGSSRNINSRSIHWKKNVLADNTTYSHYLSKLWTPESLPPWNFIRSCKSFHPEILSARESTTDRAKLSTISSQPETSHQYAVKTAHIWKRVGLATLTFLVLCIIITFATQKFLTHRDISGLLNEIHIFLSKYPVDVSLPFDHKERGSIIREALTLLNNTKALEGETSNKDIKESVGNLSAWINDAKHTDERLRNFSDLVKRSKRLVLSSQQLYYPPPKNIKKVLAIKNEFVMHLKYPLVLGKEGVSQSNRAVKRLNAWISSHGSTIEHLQRRVESIRGNIPPTDNLEGYSKSKHIKYIKAKLELNILRDKDSYKNAVNSPIEIDKATTLRITLDTTRAKCEHLIGESFVNRSNDPFYVDKEDKQIEFLKQAKDSFQNAKRYFSNIEGVSQDILEGVTKDIQSTSNEIGKRISRVNNKILDLKAVDDPND